VQLAANLISNIRHVFQKSLRSLTPRALGGSRIRLKSSESILVSGTGRNVTLRPYNAVKNTIFLLITSYARDAHSTCFLLLHVRREVVTNRAIVLGLVAVHIFI
jgi:hypothetical protein